MNNRPTVLINIVCQYSVTQGVTEVLEINLIQYLKLFINVGI